MKNDLILPSKARGENELAVDFAAELTKTLTWRQIGQDGAKARRSLLQYVAIGTALISFSAAAGVVFDGEDRTAAGNSPLLSGQAGKKRLVLRSGIHHFVQASRLFWEEIFLFTGPCALVYGK
jgi:hypothetical protein